MTMKLVQAVDYDVTDEQWRDATDRFLRDYLHFNGNTAYAQVPTSLVRDLLLPALTVETVIPTFVVVLAELYDEQLDTRNFDHLFNRAYQLNRSYDWRYMLIELHDDNRGALAKWQLGHIFSQDEFMCERALGDTNLASGFAYLFVVLAMFLAHMPAYSRKIEGGATEWMARMYPLLTWFHEVSKALNVSTEVSA